MGCFGGRGLLAFRKGLVTEQEWGWTGVLWGVDLGGVRKGRVGKWG